MAGYVVEEKIFGTVTTGPSNDLQVASALARDMVTKYGMSDKFGPIAFEPTGGRAMFGNNVDERSYSPVTGDEIDKEVARLMREARETVEKIISEKRSALDAVALALIDKETLEQAEYEEIVKAHGMSIEK